jgi:hypothetical protein
MALRTASIVAPVGWRGSPALPSDRNDTGRSLGREELAAVRDALTSGVLGGLLVFPLNERFGAADVSRVAAAIRASVAELRVGNAV